MQYEQRIVGQTLVVNVEGEFDLHTAPPFKDSMDKQLENDRAIRHLIFNLEKVTFIDSSGLGVILGRFRTIQARGGKLIFSQTPPQIRRVLELSGFKKIAEFTESTREALERV